MQHRDLGKRSEPRSDIKPVAGAAAATDRAKGCQHHFMSEAMRAEERRAKRTPKRTTDVRGVVLLWGGELARFPTREALPQHRTANGANSGASVNPRGVWSCSGVLPFYPLLNHLWRVERSKLGKGCSVPKGEGSDGGGE